MVDPSKKQLNEPPITFPAGSGQTHLTGLHQLQGFKLQKVARQQVAIREAM